MYVASSAECRPCDLRAALRTPLRKVPLLAKPFRSRMQETCPYCDVEEGVFRSGENWTSSKEPCVSYLCDQGQAVEKRVQCTKIEKCSDGNAPFHMAGECCLSCSQPQTTLVSRAIATLSEWSEWEPCSRSCGSGRRSRSRRCMHPDNSVRVVEVNCQGLLHEVEFCNTDPCPSERPLNDVS